jgi:hypothetical protein
MKVPLVAPAAAQERFAQFEFDRHFVVFVLFDLRGRPVTPGHLKPRYHQVGQQHDTFSHRQGSVERIVVGMRTPKRRSKNSGSQ